jgi:hypothetical protein
MTSHRRDNERFGSEFPHGLHRSTHHLGQAINATTANRYRYPRSRGQPLPQPRSQNRLADCPGYISHFRLMPPLSQAKYRREHIFAHGRLSTKHGSAALADHTLRKPGG